MPTSTRAESRPPAISAARKTRQYGALARGALVSSIRQKMMPASVAMRRASTVRRTSSPVPQAYGTTEEGQLVNLYTLTNDEGMEVTITNYGSTVVALEVPDRDGKFEDVVLGYDKLEDYEKGQSYFGGTIGRYANRIAHGKFTIGGRDYVLPKNNGDNTLHGGIKGFNKRVWAAKDISSSSGHALQLTYLSEDGEEGFPGSLSVTAIFNVPADRNDVRIDYSATTGGKGTILNLTNHSFFNLAGAGYGNILGHRLIVRASQFTPIDAKQVPTGEFRNAAGTPFDFGRATVIGERIYEDCEQLNFGKGYDHNWVLNRTGPGSLDLAAQAYDTSTRTIPRQMGRSPPWCSWTSKAADQ